MPIIPGSLKITELGDPGLGPGVKTWRIEAIDSRGRLWVQGSFKVTQAEAEAKRDAAVFDLVELDLRELLEFVQLGDPNTVAAFDYTNRDITEDAGEEHIFQWFAEAGGAEAITVAWWMDGINTGKFNSIRDRIGYTGAQGSDITSRFTFMVTVEPFYDLTIEAP